MPPTDLAEQIINYLETPPAIRLANRFHSDPREAAVYIFDRLTKQRQAQIISPEHWVAVNAWYHLKNYFIREVSKRLKQSDDWEDTEP